MLEFGRIHDLHTWWSNLRLERNLEVCACSSSSVLVVISYRLSAVLLVAETMANCNTKVSKQKWLHPGHENVLEQ